MSNSLPQNTEQALQLIRLLYHVNLTVIYDHQALEAFSRRYRFHPLQHMFSVDNMRQLLRDLNDGQILFLTDAFRVRTAMFYLDGVPVLLGPFTSVLLTERDVKSLLLQYPLPNVKESELLYYLNSFPCLPETQVSGILTSLLQVLYPEEKARDILSINYLEKAEITLIYTEEPFLGTHARAAEIVRFMNEDGSITPIIAQEGCTLYEYHAGIRD